ncbi:hypothetical protein [Streptomyces sp. NPDC002588]|uniref:hypothetical protein n=1 Tax=Streptomyces sp. NPDC002588 TaxID=3154419 RepID=UPI00332FD5B2
MTDEGVEETADLRAAGWKAVRAALQGVFPEDEIAEVVHRSSGCAGFPRAVAARTAAREALKG